MIRWSEEEYKNLMLKKTGKMPAKRKKENKYKNTKVIYNGIKFDSKKECNRYIELSRLASTGCISDLRLQVPFVLQETFKDNTGRTERSIKYLADFVYSKGSRKYIEDVKSPITRKEPTYIIKRKLLKYKYPEYTFIEV